jgi:uncharacterized protein YbaP (TraB family)
MKRLPLRWSGLALLLTLWGVCPAGAQPSNAAAATRHSLWKVEGGTNVVYLLGSFHLLKAEDYPLAPPMEAAFSNSTVAAFETDLEEMDKPETALKMMSKCALPAGQTLKEQLSPGLYEELNRHATQAGVPMMALDNLRPALAVMMLEVSALLKLGVDPEYGVDKYFFGRARKDGKTIVPLETMDFQIGLLTDFSKEEGELLVKTSLIDIDNAKKDYDEMVAAWRTGDSTAMAKLLNQATQESPVIYKRLVSDRNQSWVPRIEELLRGNKKAIVIVGAGHLVGSDGVVELLLKKKNLKVTQL